MAINESANMMAMNEDAGWDPHPTMTPEEFRKILARIEALQIQRAPRNQLRFAGEINSYLPAILKGLSQSVGQPAPSSDDPHSVYTHAYNRIRW